MEKSEIMRKLTNANNQLRTADGYLDMNHFRYDPLMAKQYVNSAKLVISDIISTLFAEGVRPSGEE